MTLLKYLGIGFAALTLLLAAYSVVASWWLERQYPPLGEFVDVAGERLHYVRRGQGQPIVLLHGLNASLRDFDASLLDGLAKDFQVIAFDRPGYGYSTRSSGHWLGPKAQADLIHEALQVLGIEEPILVGHSWAGSVVMAYLLHHSEHAGGGVLLAGATHPWDGGVSANVKLAGVPVLGHLFTSTLVLPLGQLFFEGAVAGVFAPELPTENYIERTGAMLALRPKAYRSSAEDRRNLSKFLESQSQNYGDIDRPLLLVTAEQDTIVPAWNHANRVAAVLPKAERVDFGGAGHALHHSRSEDVVSAIRQFAAKQRKGK